MMRDHKQLHGPRGTWLRTKRKIHGLTKQQVCNFTGISVVNLHHYENMAQGMPDTIYFELRALFEELDRRRPAAIAKDMIKIGNGYVIPLSSGNVMVTPVKAGGFERKMFEGDNAMERAKNFARRVESAE